jgi:hypothetical protein
VGRVWPRHSGGGRPLNSVVSHHMTAERSRVPVPALLIPPTIVLGLVLLFSFANLTIVVSIAISTVAVGVIVEGFAVAIAVTAILHDAALRTVRNYAATTIGVASLLVGVGLLIAIAGGV